jgi:hypothetical protein
MFIHSIAGIWLTAKWGIIKLCLMPEDGGKNHVEMVSFDPNADMRDFNKEIKY